MSNHAPLERLCQFEIHVHSRPFFPLDIPPAPTQACRALCMSMNRISIYFALGSITGLFLFGCADQTQTQNQTRNTPGLHAAVPGAPLVTRTRREMVVKAYDDKLATTISNRWNSLLAAQPPVNAVGLVKLQFHLLPDGKVNSMKVISSTMSSNYTAVCKRAVSESAPFSPWPMEMYPKETYSWPHPGTRIKKFLVYTNDYVLYTNDFRQIDFSFHFYRDKPKRSGG